jgi:ubiquinone/menaquinone biosynthesis C-methylase UbiE
MQFQDDVSPSAIRGQGETGVSRRGEVRKNKMSKLFDEQAKTFDSRAGLPNGAVESIVSALVDITKGTPATHWLEIGVGTGEIGSRLAQLPLYYVGFDSSLPMLMEFKRRTILPASATLLQSDGNQPWPVKKNTIQIFFSSRALHHLQADHVLDQLQRTGSSDGWLLITGKVYRDKTSSKSILKREMKRILNAAGYQGRGGETSNDSIYQACEALGGEIIGSRVAYRWKTLYAPIQSLHAWETKNGLDGLVLPQEEKSKVLSELTRYAKVRFGDLEKGAEIEERYELTILSLNP